MIEIQELQKSFGSRVLFQNVNLRFKEGKIYALIGTSGCGKTTLLNILAQLEPYDSGSILYNGKDLQSIKQSKYFKDELGYLFQNYGLLDNQSVKANLDLGLIGKKIQKSEVIQKEKEALKNVGLDYIKLNQKIYELSGGEAQRIAIAKMILKNPPLILADEPTASLDPRTSKEIMDSIISLKKSDRIIIIATHNPSIWERADEIIKIHEISGV